MLIQFEAAVDDDGRAQMWQARSKMATSRKLPRPCHAFLWMKVHPLCTELALLCGKKPCVLRHGGRTSDIKTLMRCEVNVGDADSDLPRGAACIQLRVVATGHRYRQRMD